MPMTNIYGSTPPSNNSMWIGNNYAAPRNYPSMNQQVNAGPSFISQPQSINNILQVMGPESAQSYQTGPDSHVILMDSNRPVFYLKKSDSTGYAETRAFEFHEIPLMQSPVQTQKTTDSQLNQDFVTKADFEEFKKMIEELVMKNE